MADTKISALTSATTPLAGTEVLPIVQSSTTVKVSVANLTSGRAVTGLSFAATDALNCISSSYASGVQLGSTTAYVYSKILNTYANGGVVIGYDTASQTGVIAGNNDLDVYTYGSGWQKAFSFDTSANLVPKVAAKGINFTANTPAAGMTSQLLNWYEEGTWTPVLNRSSTAPSVTYTTQTGTYTRKGREVTLKGNLVWTANSGGTGYFTITGQPFVASATGLNSGVIGLLDGFTYAVGTTQIAVAIVSGGNFISFYTFGSAVGGSIVSTVANAGEVDICITYFV